uniref:PDZ domain-containing protein n=1 Tax=Macrostomum lignano TaxID=282301 RepID=A0A1I8FKL9_9PLAT
LFVGFIIERALVLRRWRLVPVLAAPSAGAPGAGALVLACPWCWRPPCMPLVLAPLVLAPLVLAPLVLAPRSGAPLVLRRWLVLAPWCWCWWRRPLVLAPLAPAGAGLPLVLAPLVLAPGLVAGAHWLRAAWCWPLVLAPAGPWCWPPEQFVAENRIASREETNRMELNVATPVQSGYHLAWQRPTADPAHQPPRSRCYSTKRSPHSRLVSLDNGHAERPCQRPQTNPRCRDERPELAVAMVTTPVKAAAAVTEAAAAAAAAADTRKQLDFQASGWQDSTNNEFNRGRRCRSSGRLRHLSEPLLKNRPPLCSDCFVTWLARQRQTEAQDSQTASATVREPCDFTRPIGGRFGFYVAKESRGEVAAVSWHPGDRIIELEGDPGQSAGAGRHSARLAHRRVCGFELFAVERTLPWETALLCALSVDSAATGAAAKSD